MRHFTHHLSHYLPLVGILFAGVVGFKLSWYDKNFQTAVVIATAAGYVVWGIIHHHLHNDLYISVLLEYITIAVLGVVIIITMLFTA